MDLTEIIGLTAGILTASSLVPQVIKTIREKKAEDVSLVMLIVLLSGLILWVLYGFKRNDLPLIITNAFSIVVNLVMVFLRIKYREK